MKYEQTLLDVKKAVTAKLGVPVAQQQLFLHNKVRCCLMINIMGCQCFVAGRSICDTATNTSSHTKPEQLQCELFRRKSAQIQRPCPSCSLACTQVANACLKRLQRICA